MNRNRKKTILPLEYQIEAFFKKVIYLNHELITKKIDKNSKPLDIENLDLETLIYEGMKRYEELVNIFKINSEKESKITEKEEVRDKEKKQHKKPLTKNKTDVFNFGKRRSENIIDYRFKMNEQSNKNEQNDDLDNSRTSKKNLIFGSSYDKYLKDLKYNFKGDQNRKSNIFNKNKRNSMFDKKDIFSSYFKNQKEDKNNSQNKYYNYNDYEKKDQYDQYDKYDNEYDKGNQYDVKDNIGKYDNKYDDENDKYNEYDRYNEYDKKVKKDEYPKNDENNYEEQYPNNEYDNKNKGDKFKVNDNKENYNKINFEDEYKERERERERENEDKIKKTKKRKKEKFNARLSLNQEPKFETFKRNITDDKYFKNTNMSRKVNSIQGRYKYQYKYIGNRDKNVSEVSDSKQNRWMKKKTNINNSIISRSKNGDFEESQDISRNTWMKKRIPLTGLHKNVFGNANRNQVMRNNLINNLKMKDNSLGKRYEKHDFKDFKDFEIDNYKGKLSRSNNFENDMIKSSINIRENKEKNNFAVIKNDNDDDANKLFVNTKKIGSDIYNINYGKIVNKNMYINVYKTESNNNNYSKNQDFAEKRGNEDDNMYNYTQNYCNVYKDEDDDDNFLGEYGTKLVGKEMLKKNIRDKEERERLSKQNLNIYSSV